MEHFVLLSVLALAIEAVMGYPRAVYQRLGHPVTWIGALIARLESLGNASGQPAARKRLYGVLAVLVLLTVCAGAGWVASAAAQRVGLAGLLLLAVAASTLLAQCSLHDHVARVADALDQGGVAAGRAAVSQIVGRDPESLDEPGVARAAIESLAENFADGVVAPAFWLAAGGLTGGLLYKAINTADSMIGHLNERYRDFGWAAARLDDLVNLPASRLAAVWLAAAALVTPGTSAAGAIRTVFRDAHRHRSPNAGWPEAAMAGALGLTLAGPRSYGGASVADAFIGSGRAEVTAADIRSALSLYRCACLIQFLTLAALALGIALLAR